MTNQNLKRVVLAQGITWCFVAGIACEGSRYGYAAPLLICGVTLLMCWSKFPE